MGTLERDGFYAHLTPSLPLPDDYPLNSTSPGYEKSRSCGGGGSRLFGFAGYSSNVAAQFILVFDANILPANGVAPVVIVPAAAASVFSAYYGTAGRWFRHGIIIATSTTGPTLTLGAADTFFDVQFV